MFKLVLFDLDNSLYNDNIEKECYEIICKYLQSNNINVTYLDCIKAKEKAKLNSPNTLNRLLYFKQLVGSQNLSLALDCYNLYWISFYTNIKLFDGVLDLLKLLKANNIKMKICTNFTLEHQIKKCNYLNITHFFDDIVTNEESLFSKPNKQIFNYALNEELPGQTMIIGDNIETDIKGGVSNGIFSFYFNKDSKDNFKILNYQNNKIIEFNSYSILFNFFTIYFDKLKILIEISKRVGERIDLTQAAGGNISIKFTFNK